MGWHLPKLARIRERDKILYPLKVSNYPRKKLEKLELSKIKEVESKQEERMKLVRTRNSAED